MRVVTKSFVCARSRADAVQSKWRGGSRSPKVKARWDLHGPPYLGKCVSPWLENRGASVKAKLPLGVRRRGGGDGVTHRTPSQTVSQDTAPALNSSERSVPHRGSISCNVQRIWAGARTPSARRRERRAAHRSPGAPEGCPRWRTLAVPWRAARCFDPFQEVGSSWRRCGQSKAE